MVKNYWEEKKSDVFKRPVGMKSNDSWSGKDLPRLIPLIETAKLKELTPHNSITTANATPTNTNCQSRLNDKIPQNKKTRI